jgi:RNA polymerase primary sigma factor
MEVGIKAIPYNLAMRQAREEAKLTQARLAELVGCSTSVISAIERLCQPVNEELATEIALALGYEIDYLFPLETRQFRSVKSRSVEFLWQVESIDSLSSEELEGLVLPAPGEALEHDELVQAIQLAISALSARERAVIRLRYGFEGEPYTLEEVGALFGVSRERVKQIEGKALRRLRHPAVRRKLGVFV